MNRLKRWIEKSIDRKLQRKIETKIDRKKESSIPHGESHLKLPEPD